MHSHGCTDLKARETFSREGTWCNSWWSPGLPTPPIRSSRHQAWCGWNWVDDGGRASCICDAARSFPHACESLRGLLESTSIWVRYWHAQVLQGPLLDDNMPLSHPGSEKSWGQKWHLPTGAQNLLHDTWHSEGTHHGTWCRVCDPGSWVLESTPCTVWGGHTTWICLTVSIPPCSGNISLFSFGTILPLLSLSWDWWGTGASSQGSQRPYTSAEFPPVYPLPITLQLPPSYHWFRGLIILTCWLFVSPTGR